MLKNVYKKVSLENIITNLMVKRYKIKLCGTTHYTTRPVGKSNFCSDKEYFIKFFKLFYWEEDAIP